MPAETCIFCNPDPANLILTSARGIVLLDDPVRVGHVLVGATVHEDGLHSLPPDKAADTMSLAAEVAREIVALTGAEKVYVAAVGDKDKHFHVHLIPRYKDDAGLGPHIFGGKGWVGTLGQDPAKGDEAEVRSRIADSIE